MFHLEFQSSPDAQMVERLLEYVVLLRRDLHRSGWMATDGGRVVAHVPLVVYNSRAMWRTHGEPRSPSRRKTACRWRGNAVVVKASIQPLGTFLGDTPNQSSCESKVRAGTTSGWPGDAKQSAST